LASKQYYIAGLPKDITALLYDIARHAKDITHRAKDVARSAKDITELAKDLFPHKIEQISGKTRIHER
jgi:hypothetical protein